MYMRMSMLAQSWLSVPPAPEWTSRYASFASASPESSVSTCRRAASACTPRIATRPLDRRPRRPRRRRARSGSRHPRGRPRACRSTPGSVLKLGALAHDLLRGFGVVPEVGVLGAGVQLGKAARGGIDVKDASSAVPRTAWRHRRALRFRRASVDLTEWVDSARPRASPGCGRVSDAGQRCKGEVCRLAMSPLAGCRRLGRKRPATLWAAGFQASGDESAALRSARPKARNRDRPGWSARTGRCRSRRCRRRSRRPGRRRRKNEAVPPAW